MLSYVAAWHLSAGFTPIRTKNSAHPSLIPFQSFKTADGWIVVACAKEKFWKRLVGALGRPELGTDPRYERFSVRKKNAATLMPKLESYFSARPTADWLSALTAAGVPCGPVNDVGQALADPLVTERNMIVETDHPTLGAVRQLGGVVRVGPFRPVHQRGPLLGEHTSQVLADLLGADDARVRELAETGAFGRAAPAPETKREERYA
jgi:crotonobetainyl-CoA:carnitine CoA-transferase CaiB-like acyl-CoA transferase